MIYDRLYWWLEKFHLLSLNQGMFCCVKQSINQSIRLVQVTGGEHVAAFFILLQQSSGHVWRTGHGLLLKMQI